MRHYTSTPDKTSLVQGDLIGRSSAVEDLLLEVHPHFHKNPSYPYFIVLTQACDLVRRGATGCKSRYISLAGVRSLALVLERTIQRYQPTDTERRVNIISERLRQRLTQFLEHLLNNNEPEYFFLYREPAVGVDDDYCAFLRVSIAVKSDLHYDTLLAAKLLQLDESFEHKLGYLVGNTYARIGTEDWVPTNMAEAEFGELIRNKLGNAVTWIPAQIYEKLVRRVTKLPAEGQTLEAVAKVVTHVKGEQQQRKQAVLDSVSATLTEFNVPEATIERSSSDS